jgi:Arc/MetJ family transcription regulator
MDIRTNIVLDEDLVAQAMARAGVKTKKAAVEAALRAYVRKPDYSGLLALQGSDVLADGYDPKATTTAPIASPAARRAPARDAAAGSRHGHAKR